MKKNIVYLYVLDTLADWEAGYAISELHSKRYFKQNTPPYVVKTLAESKEPVTTMGGVKIIPDETIEKIDLNEVAMLVLPGSEEWDNPKHAAVLDLAKRLLENDTPVAAICGATSAMADKGLLDNFKHTSNDLNYLQYTCKNYNGSKNYIEKPAVTDRNLITASSVGPLEFAYEIFKKLDAFSIQTLEAWYNLHHTKKPQYFYELMESLNSR